MTNVLKINYKNIKKHKTQKQPKSYKSFLHNQKNVL